MKKFRIFALGIFLVSNMPLGAEPTRSSGLPMDRVYQGRIQLPDFAGRDRQFATFRTRIANEMSTGPNFAGHYALVEMGCGTGCRFVVIGDVATGRVARFPYGGEEYNMLDLRYGVKSNYVTAQWVSNGRCYSDFLEWTGETFKSSGKSVIGNSETCR